ncbi:MAG: hypothetical protein RJB13_2248, partial [Pseudomonadota bacterium]
VKIKGIDPKMEQRLVQHHSVKTFSSELLNARRGAQIWQFEKITPILVTDKVARALGKLNVRTNKSDSVAGGPESDLSYDCDDKNFVMHLSKDSNVQLAARTYLNSFSAVDAEVVGFYTSGLELLEESAALVPIDSLRKLYETQGATNVVVYLPWGSDEKKAEDRLVQALKLENLNFEVHNYKKFSVNPFYAGFMNLIYVMSSFFLTLAIAVVTLTVADTMTMSVLERTREIGTLRALGFKQKQITKLFTLEGVFLALLCLPVGFITASIAAIMINSFEFMFEVPGISTKIKVVLEVVPKTSLVLGVILIAVTGFAGWLTSRRTSKKTITGLLQTHVS